MLVAKRIYFVLLLIMLCVSFKQPINAAQLHAMIVGDSVGGEDGFQSSIDFMQRAVKRIAAATDLSLNAQCFEGYQVQIKNILEHISALTIGPDDVVICYFSLHGSRTLHKDNPWPDLNFTLDTAFSGEEGYLDFHTIHEGLKKKNPRLFLSIADSCNSIRSEGFTEDDDEDMPLPNRTPFSIPTPACQQVVLNHEEMACIKGTMEDDTIEAYRHLFLNERGCIIVSSSSPGEKAVNLPITGGVYTVEFLRSLDWVTSMWCLLSDKHGKEPTWSFLLDLASLETLKTLEALKSHKATPQYEIQ